MKQRALLLSLTLCSLAPSHAQSWCPPGAEWYYRAAFCMGGCHGYIRMWSAGDTVIQNQPCTRIERIRIYTAYYEPTIHVDTMSDLYTYSASGLVWMFDPQLNAFDTLYDLNASPGDSWQLIHLPEPNYFDPSFSLTVLDTGHITLDGNSLRWLSVQYDFGDLWSDQIILDTLIERIGSNTYYMLPYDLPNGLLDGQEGGSFRCYSDNTISYQSPTVETCELPLGGMEPIPRPMILLYPNPGTDRLTVRMPIGDKMQGVLVRDALGRICFDGTAAAEKEFVLDTEGLPQGCYSIEVRSTHGQFVQRWIKE